MTVARASGATRATSGSVFVPIVVTGSDRFQVSNFIGYMVWVSIRIRLWARVRVRDSVSVTVWVRISKVLWLVSVSYRVTLGLGL